MAISNLTACASAAFLGALCLAFMGRVKAMGTVLTALDTGCLGVVVFFRYLEAWLMLPMYIGLVLFAFCSGCLWLLLHRSQSGDTQYLIVLDATLFLLPLLLFLAVNTFIHTISKLYTLFHKSCCVGLLKKTNRLTLSIHLMHLAVSDARGRDLIVESPFRDEICREVTRKICGKRKAPAPCRSDAVTPPVAKALGALIAGIESSRDIQP